MTEQMFGYYNKNAAARRFLLSAPFFGAVSFGSAAAAFYNGQIGTKGSGHLPNTEDLRVYLCIDLKSFYASVECVERGLDPFRVNLVVADPDRTDKTICLAITPAMKALGVRNRCRVFEIPPGMDYIMAVPRMHLYLEYSARIYAVYLRYVAREDIHIYSVDEAFLDVTHYLKLYGLRARELAVRIMNDIFETTGITATCGIGTNLYLTKIALDITAKHVPEHIGILTEERYRASLWDHRPLTDFWRIGPGTAAHLARLGMDTMRQVAAADEDLLYKEFGIDAELLIDHAWGREPVTIADIKQYRPKSNSLSSGQILPWDYHFDDGLLVVKEMTEQLGMELLDKGLVTSAVTLLLSYSRASGVPYSRGTESFPEPVNSCRKLLETTENLYRRIVRPEAAIRRIGLDFHGVEPERGMQCSLFDDPKQLERERSLSGAILTLRDRYGKSAVFRGMDLQENARTLERNAQIGGHRA